MTKDQLDALFHEAFPLKTKDEMMSLEYVELLEPLPGEFKTVIRLVVWDVDGEKQSIRDVKEQEVYLDMPIETTLDRLRIYLEGMRLALADVGGQNVETLMPHDLMIWKPLALKRAHTAEDFAKALRVKSRLGKYLLSS